ncbi:uncharacterized protein LOC141775662 [Sebastes fasciatus]|uniref:uncharacterized protein LOC141775662 n=1 Tax=Sebastes fasciatus TaxID=394691 RepID=UPI003D9E8FBD
MILFWVTLLVLHRGYTLVPVTTVQLGEPATFTCALPNIANTRIEIHWYKQSTRETLQLMVTLHTSAELENAPEYAPQFSESRLEVNNDDSFSNLTILRTIQEDEGLYHCEIADRWSNPEWSGTYLSLKGNTRRTSNYTQWYFTSDPVRPGDSVTLQCSVLSDSESKCPGDHSVFWFRARSDESHPSLIYAHGNGGECENSTEARSQQKCVYSFSKNVGSSDAGTYYCAVATCGEILFGNGTKLDVEERTARYEFIALVIATVCLVISVIGNIVFICCRTSRAVCSQFKGIESVASQARHDNSSLPLHDFTEGGPELNYAALHFSGKKATRGRKKRELNTEESVYSQVKC